MNSIWCSQQLLSFITISDGSSEAETRANVQIIVNNRRLFIFINYNAIITAVISSRRKWKLSIRIYNIYIYV